MGMVKKGASGVLASLPDLRAHRLAALRGVRAHVLGVRSARLKGFGLARGKGHLGALGFGRVTKRTLRKDSGHAFFSPFPSAAGIDFV